MSVLPLEGYRVIDLTSVVMGPLATQMLADQGADVIVVEQPAGDANRHMGLGPHRDLSGPALNLMRNKRSIVLDIRHPRGYEVLVDLVRSADVFVTNLRPGSRARARLTDDDLRPHRPDLVYCSVAGFAADDPRADHAAYDDIVQAAAGFVDIHDRAGLTSTAAPTILVDKIVGMAVANAITTALLHRERTGLGSEIAMSMQEIASAWLLVEHGAAAIPEPPTGPPGYPRLLSPQRRPLRTSDGAVAILTYERHHFEGLARLADRDDLLADPRFLTRLGRLEHIDELYREYQTIAARFDTATFLERCRAHGVPAHEVVTLDDIIAELRLADHPHAGRYRVTPSLGPATAASIAPRPAPLIGEHGPDILRSLGYPADQIDDLVGLRVLGSDPCEPADRPT
ncbi:CaiB/BaiF CoA transferase family protein [Desertimonas flava]|uniref:CaiB/BaiF CoA transferase family protein n=1 Tax=Desertimonas flava TaxID=2064846 RepID=UPI0013C4E2A4|nr:CoA transferase [Desertimonas flava]